MDNAALQKIQNVRMRMQGGEDVPLEEYQEAVRLMRDGRVSAQTASDSSRRKKAVVDIPSADDLLGDLMK